MELSATLKRTLEINKYQNAKGYKIFDTRGAIEVFTSDAQRDLFFNKMYRHEKIRNKN